MISYYIVVLVQDKGGCIESRNTNKKKIDWENFEFKKFTGVQKGQNLG